MKLFTLMLLTAFISGCIVVPVGGRTETKSGSGPAVVCHKGKKTMELPPEAVGAHLDHGDSMGPC